MVWLEVEQLMEPEPGQLEEPEVASKMGEEPLQMTERNSEAMAQHLGVVASERPELVQEQPQEQPQLVEAA